MLYNFEFGLPFAQIKHFLWCFVFWKSWYFYLLRCCHVLLFEKYVSQNNEYWFEECLIGPTKWKIHEIPSMRWSVCPEFFSGTARSFLIFYTKFGSRRLKKLTWPGFSMFWDIWAETCPKWDQNDGCFSSFVKNLWNFSAFMNLQKSYKVLKLT